MINKGESCISAVLNGSIPIALIKHGLNTIFKKETPVEPDIGYITNGLEALFSGEDGYYEGVWVDRINGHTFTPISASTAPVHDAENKLYNATSFGGMVSDIQSPSDGLCSLEVVTRDVKNVTRNGNNYGTIIGGTMSNYAIGNGLVIVKNASNQISLQSYKSQTCTYKPINNSEFVNNGLDTLTIVPNVGFFRNGVKVGDCNATPGSSLIGLFTHTSGSHASTYRAKGKIHALRYYNRQLTAEEVLHNYNEDLKIYGN